MARPVGPDGAARGPGGGPPEGEGARQEPPDRCSACGSAALTRLPMVLADGTDVTFVSCQACETRQWLRPREDGRWEPLPIDTVLQRSARRR